MKNKDLQKIKLLFKYDVSKTLNENIKETKINNIDEQKIVQIAGEELGALKGAFEDAFKSAKNLGKIEIKSAEGAVIRPSNTEELLAALKDGRITPKTLGQVNSGLLKSAKTPPNVIDVIIQNPAFDKKFAETYGSMLRDEAQLTAQLKSKGYSDEVIQKMISRAKGEKYVAKDATSSFAKDTKSGEGGVNVTQKTGDVNVNANPVINNHINLQMGKLETATVEDAAANIAKDAKEAGVVKDVKYVEEIKNSEKIVEDLKTKPTAWEKIKKIARKLNKKWLWKLGLLSGGGYLIWKFLKNIKDDTRDINCLMTLLNTKKAKEASTTDGNLVVMVPSTGNSEYDDKKGLNFFSNGRVFTGDNSKKGSWSCKGDEMKTSQVAEADENSDVLQNINITWDSDVVRTDDGDGGKDDTPKQTTYHDCYDKDVNNEDIEFGCRSNQVKEIQICLGFEKRYQTGNFGPITMKAIGGNVITKEVYDKIMSKCKGSETVSGTTTGDTTTTTGTTTGDTITTTGTTGNTTNQTVNELDIQDNETGEEYYKRLFDGDYFRSDRENVGRIKLPEDTTVDPDTGEKRNVKFNDKSIKALDGVFDKLKTRRAPYGYYRAKQNVQNDEGDRKFVWFAKKTPDQKTQLSEEKIKNIVIKNLHSLL